MRGIDHHSGLRQARAFSLVELLVVIGLAMIVLSLALPMLRASMREAKLMRWLALTSQHGASIQMHAAGHHDIYPVGHPNAWSASQRWYEPLIDEGFYGSEAAVDPEGPGKIGVLVYWMSRCMLEHPSRMTPGQTLPADDQRSTPVGQHKVAFPASKGLVLQSSYPQMPLESAFSASGPYVESPAAFADGSAALGNRLDFNLGQEPVLDENSYGVPVWSTWGGFLARDR